MRIKGIGKAIKLKAKMTKQQWDTVKSGAGSYADVRQKKKEYEKGLEELRKNDIKSEKIPELEDRIRLLDKFLHFAFKGKMKEMKEIGELYDKRYEDDF